MTLIIELSPEVEERLRQEAARRGQPTADYARAVLESSLTGAASYVGIAAPRRSPAELVALAQQQGVGPVERFEDLLGEPAVADESDVDDFIALRREWRSRPAGFTDEP